MLGCGRACTLKVEIVRPLEFKAKLGLHSVFPDGPIVRLLSENKQQGAESQQLRALAVLKDSDSVPSIHMAPHSCL